MNSRAILILLFLLLGLLPGQAPANGPATGCSADKPTPGDGFKTYGSVKISGPGINAVAVQPDAKIVIGGDFTLTDDDPADSWHNLARLNPDGTIDNSFNPPVLDGPVNAIALQPNLGFIIVGGGFRHAGADDRVALARFASGDGSLDGFAPVSAGLAVSINAVALMPDGVNLLVGGSFNQLETGVSSSANLAGISAAASGTGAPNWSYSGAPLGEVRAVVLQPDGNILAGGGSVARLNPDGSPDAGFAVFTPGAGRILAMALQVDGKIVIGGDFAGGPLARLTGAGALDPFNVAFNPGGKLYSTVIQADGRILVGGSFSIGSGASLRVNLARININATLESAIYPAPDGSVNAIAQQSDGKVLAGGAFGNAGAAPRTRLARFYHHGALDDSVPFLGFNGVGLGGSQCSVVSLSLHPDGSKTLAGLFDLLNAPDGSAVDKFHNGRFKEDWTLDETFNPNLFVSVYALGYAQQPDDSLILNGLIFYAADDFGPWIDDYRFTGFDLVFNPPPVQNSVLRIGPHGYLDPSQFNPNLSLFGYGFENGGSALALLPKGTRSNGSELEDGMFYFGGGPFQVNPAFPCRFLTRVNSKGERDPGFPDPADPTALAAIDSEVTALAIQPDNKILAGMWHDYYPDPDTRLFSAKLLRLTPEGRLDPSFTALHFDGELRGLVLQRDGQIVVTGQFPDHRNVLRIDSRGNPDPGFHVETYSTAMNYADPTYTYVNRAVLQANGDLVVYGMFDHLTDSVGNTFCRTNVARIKADGQLDQSFDLGSSTIGYAKMFQEPIGTANLQTDGKLIIGGNFQDASITPFLARFNNGWASQVLSLSPDGAQATWLRGGTGPELWRVWFEYAADPDAAPGTWTFLGNGVRTAARDGWELDVRHPAAFPAGLPRGVNGYLRARGYAAGERGSNGSLVDSVRIFNLDAQLPAPTVVTVTADPASKTYGDNDPLSFGYSTVPQSAAANLSGTLTREPGETVRSYTIGHPGELSISGNYLLVFVPGTFSIGKKSASVTANPSGKSYGDADPPLSGALAGFLAGDNVSASLLRGAGETVSGSPYAISATLAPPSVLGNYDVTYTGAPFAIGKKAASVTARAASKSYGDPDPPLSTTNTGFLPGDLGAGKVSFSATRVAGESAGTYDITPQASDNGSALLANYLCSYLHGALTVTKADQSIVLPPLPAKTYGDPDFNPGGNSPGGLPISYASSDPAVAVVVNGQLRITGAGSTPITASQAGDANHNPSSATTLLTVAKATLRVTADDKTRAWETDNPPLTATYTGFVRGETLAGAAIQGAPALSTGATPESPVGSYPISVAVDQLSAPNYSFTPVNGSLNVTKSCQEIVFPPIGDRTYGDPPFVIQASACSGLALSFSIASQDPGVATLSGNVLTVTGAGSAVITASQGGSGNLDTASEVSRTVTVQRSGQALSFAPLPGRSLGDPPLTPGATSSSGLPVSYLSSAPAVAEIDGSAVRIVGAGTAVITATQAGNANYLPALPSSQPLVVAGEATPPALSLSTLSAGAVTANPVLNILGSANDPFRIASLTVNGADLTGQAALFSSAVLLSAGMNSITVSAQDGAGNRTTQTLEVTFDAAAPELTLSAPADNSVTELPLFALHGTVSTGGSVTASVNGGAAQTLPVSGGSFSGGGSLQPGVNTIELSAALAGRVSRLKRSVTLAPGKPSIAIWEPVQDLRTEADWVTLRGTVGGGGISVALDVAGVSYAPPVLAGAFQQLLPLGHAGVFPVTARVTDPDGNTSAAQRNVIRVSRVLGDLDGDGCVDIKDALAALRISLGMDRADAWALAHGDVAPLVNGVPQPDGVVDAGDVLVILRKIVGLVDF